MEELLSIIAVVVYLVVAASGKKKKGKKQREQRAGRRNQDVSFEGAFEKAMEPIRAAQRRQEAAPQRDMRAVHEACEGQRLHLHEVDQQTMLEAAEGEDPCHAGDSEQFSMDMENAFDLKEQDAGEAARDILRGVIMSEILTRPCARAAVRRNRRSNAI